MKSEIQVASGARFNYLHPERSAINITDIATSLSKMCRFTGHCRDHYSVAQHSVLVSHIVPQKYALHGLLHDGSEAYTGDINKPLKELIGSAFQDIEDRIQRAVYNRFGLSSIEPSEVHDADMIWLATEKRDLMPHGRSSMVAAYYWPLDELIVPMERHEAYEYFMNRYFELTK